MKNERDHKELLSALVDGELQGDELAQALAWAEEDQGHSDWQVYHLVGDVLRSPELAHHTHHDLLTGLRAQLAQEPPLQLQPAQLDQVAAAQPAMPSAAVARVADPVANASVFRWKMAAGFASVAAAAAIGWNFTASHSTTGSQLAQAPAQIVVPAEAGAAGSEGSVVAVSTGNGAEVLLRDPRLDELLAAHQRFGSKAALQMPADFLRNASFDRSPAPAGAATH